MLCRQRIATLFIEEASRAKQRGQLHQLRVRARRRYTIARDNQGAPGISQLLREDGNLL